MRVVAAVTATLALAFASRVAGATTPQHVTVVGDSVLTAVYWNSGPEAILSHGLDVDMQIGVCRTIAGESCPFEGQRVPTLLDLVSTLGARLGKTVVVEIGYNDPPDTFAASVKQAVNALLGVGVQRIFWLTLHEAQPSYTAMNAALVAVASGYPGAVTIVDWNGTAQGHRDWFQDDQIHLQTDGADAIAMLINQALLSAAAAPEPRTLTITPVTLPRAEVGRVYTAQLAVAGGTPQFRWSLTASPPTKGLHLLASGVIYGKPRRPGWFAFAVRVVDATGNTATSRVVLHVAAD